MVKRPLDKRFLIVRFYLILKLWNIVKWIKTLVFDTYSKGSIPFIPVY